MVYKQTKRNNPLGKKKQKKQKKFFFFCSLKQNFVPLDKVFALCKSKINEFILCFALVFVTLHSYRLAKCLSQGCSRVRGLRLYPLT